MHSIKLKTIPENLFKHLLIVQGEIKVEKKIGTYSLEKTVLKIIEDHKKNRDKNS